MLARREARRAGAVEALLLGTGGELCCGATASLFVFLGGNWLTPPVTSGCLPADSGLNGQALEPAGQRIFNPDGVSALAESFWLSPLRAG